MYRDRDFDPAAALPPDADTLIQDLELGTLFEAMAAGDAYLAEVVKRGMLWSLADPGAVRYRQHILADCLEHPEVVRRVYAIAVQALEEEKKIWGWSSLRRSVDLALHRALQVMRLFVPLLRDLRKIAQGPGTRFRSEGFQRLWAMLAAELSEDYLRLVEGHLRRLAFPVGVVFSAALGPGNRGTGYVLREPPSVRSWWERLQRWPEHWFDERPPHFVYEVADRDEAGHQALAELQRHGIARAAVALGRSAEHVLHFFGLLRAELAFYIACLNLHGKLTRSLPVCFPEALDAAPPVFNAAGLYDAALALTLGERTVANEVRADGKMLVMMTGANRGGKSTLLRSVGHAHLMMQCGMFAPAAALRASLCRGLFTHYKREEDATLRSGKLDEELKRMSDIVDRIGPYALLLCNESFGSTNEREGSQIARQILRALLERNIKVFYVTHLFDLADGLCKSGMSTALFLRAQRLPDGRRTFRLEEGAPLPTSHGQDLYRKIFEGTVS